MARTSIRGRLKALVNVAGRLGRLARVVDLDDQVEAAQRIFASDTRWTVVRGSDLEEGDSQGLPVWSRHVGDPLLESNITRRVDFALFMVEALEDDDLVHEAPAIVSRQSPSALAARSCLSPQLSLIENALSLQRSTPGASVASRDSATPTVHSALVVSVPRNRFLPRCREPRPAQPSAGARSLARRRQCLLEEEAVRRHVGVRGDGVVAG